MSFHLKWGSWDGMEDEKLACDKGSPLAGWPWSSPCGSCRGQEQQRVGPAVHFLLLYLWSLVVVMGAQKDDKCNTESVWEDTAVGPTGRELWGCRLWPQQLSPLPHQVALSFQASSTTSSLLYNSGIKSSWGTWDSFGTPTSEDLALNKAPTLSRVPRQWPCCGVWLALTSWKISLSQVFSDFLMVALQVPPCQLRNACVFVESGHWSFLFGKEF